MGSSQREQLAPQESMGMKGRKTERRGTVGT